MGKTPATTRSAPRALSGELRHRRRPTISTKRPLSATKRTRTTKSRSRMAEDTVNNSITAAAGVHPRAEGSLIERPHLHHGGVPHQFDDSEQQHEAAELGMWTFLATEVLFFGALLTAYAVYRHAHHEGFREGSLHLKEWAGAINT